MFATLILLNICFSFISIHSSIFNYLTPSMVIFPNFPFLNSSNIIFAVLLFPALAFSIPFLYTSIYRFSAAVQPAVD